MLSKDMFTEEYINSLYKRTGSDPALLERVVYAFGLLEAITRVGLPFCFKGGTSLMLLLAHPKRLSTDIDIIVEPGTDIDDYIRRAGEIFPFVDVEENIRIGRNNIEKRHFKFKYHSPVSERDVSILLDVVFEKIHYDLTIKRTIENELLLTEGDDLSVMIPDANALLGDKLTAFAPHTTGISFGTGKELEIVKQLFDCGSLFDVMTSYSKVCAAYDKTVEAQMAYRGLSLSKEEVLKDTINASLCVASRGQLYEEDYSRFKDGIYRIRNHIIGDRFNGEVAGAYAARVLYLSSSLLVDSSTITKIDDVSMNIGGEILLPKPKSFSYLRIVDPIAYGYIIESGKLLQKVVQ